MPPTFKDTGGTLFVSVREYSAGIADDIGATFCEVVEIEVHGTFDNYGTAGCPDGKRHFVTSACICPGYRYHEAVDIHRISCLRANSHDLL